MDTDSSNWLPLSAKHSVASTAEAAEIVREAGTQRTAVYPLGSGGHMRFGVRPRREGIGLDFGRWSEVLAYPAGDLTITVSAGTSLGRLDEILAEKRQWLPTAADYPPETTVGGWLSTAFPT
ncbi:MAG: FAD-binding protein, partial [Planctomycetota bacterium]